MSVSGKEYDGMLQLRFAKRVVKLLGDIYEDPRDAIRELMQNALDAGATRMDIRFERDKLIFEHNGKPIEGEYLNAFLTIGTDFKAKQHGYIGMYGIGRLAWMRIGTKAEIVTGNQYLEWDEEDPLNIRVRRLDKRFNGVRWIIHLRKDVDLDAESLKRYLETAYFGKVPVYVNGEKVESVLKNAKLIYADQMNQVYFNKDLAISLIVKYPFVAKRLYVLKGFIIITRDPRVRINAGRTVELTTEFTEWRREIARAILRTLHQKYSPSEIVETIGFDGLEDLVEMAYTEPAERVKWMVYETADGTLIRGLVLNPRNYVYSSVMIDDSSRLKLKKMGYTVIYPPSKQVEEWLNNAGYKKAEDVIDIDTAKIITVGIEEKLAVAVNAVKEAVESVVGETWRSPVISLPRGAVSVSGPFIERRPTESLVQVKIVGTIPQAGLVIVELDDEDTMAFTDGEKIYINIRNKEIQELIKETRRLRKKEKIVLLWSTIILHELLHMKGYDHTDSEWHQVYEAAMRKLIREILPKLK